RRQSPRAPLRLFSRNIQARYGLLYHGPQRHDEWVFKELLNPSTLPVNPEPVLQHGMMLYEYDTDRFDADPNDRTPNLVNLTHSAESYFVQSFSSETQRDANAGRWEYITRMARILTARAVPPTDRRGAVPVRITVNRENQMQFYLGFQEDDPVAAMRPNLADSSTFQRAMWPFLSGDES
ncbi:MAG TPA: hypothetical protein VEX86_07475, partial [Longimicrobium sp.]|nr:hypothetical protein [Longimicrobium sp.]